MNTKFLVAPRRRNKSCRNLKAMSVKGAAFIFSILYQLLDCNHAFCPHPSKQLIAHQQKHNIERGRIKLYQMGSDYLNNLSANSNNNKNNDNQQSDDNGKDDERGRRNTSLIANAFLNDVTKRTSDITSGISNAAERGSTDIQSLTKSAITGVERVTKKGSRDIKRTTLGAQKVLKKSTSGLLDATKTGKGSLTDMHFFDVPSSFGSIVNYNPPKINADEIVKWIDSQAKSGTEVVGSKAKALVLNFTGKRQYQFGDVTREVIHRVSSYDINMQDLILLLKVSSVCDSFGLSCWYSSLHIMLTYTNPLSTSDSSCAWSDYRAHS